MTVFKHYEFTVELLDQFLPLVDWLSRDRGLLKRAVKKRGVFWHRGRRLGDLFLPLILKGVLMID